jgi:hypothetical protein
MGGSDQKDDEKTEDQGLIIGHEGETRGVAAKFIKAMAQHRHWERELKAQPS